MADRYTIGLLDIVIVNFVTLKFAGLVDWSWPVTLAPLGVAVGLAALQNGAKKWARRRRRVEQEQQDRQNHAAMMERWGQWGRDQEYFSSTDTREH